MSAPPTLPPMESTESGFNPDFSSPTTANGNGYLDGNATSPVDGSAAAPAVQPLEQSKQQDAQDPKAQEAVNKVLYSDVRCALELIARRCLTFGQIGVNTLLNRLKASIASARVRIVVMLYYPLLIVSGLCDLSEASRGHGGRARE